MLQHMILYECQGNSQQLYEMSRESGGMCNRQALPCNAIVAAWVKGSKVSQTIQLFVLFLRSSRITPSFTEQMLSISSLNIFLFLNIELHIPTGCWLCT